MAGYAFGLAAMAYVISFILTRCGPPQIAPLVVFLVVVPMCDFVFWTWLWPAPSRAYQNMHHSCVVFPKIDLPVTLGLTEFQYAAFDWSHASSTTVNNSVQRSNAAKARHLIAWVSLDRTPFFRYVLISHRCACLTLGLGRGSAVTGPLSRLLPQFRLLVN